MWPILLLAAWLATASETSAISLPLSEPTTLHIAANASMELTANASVGTTFFVWEVHSQHLPLALAKQHKEASSAFPVTTHSGLVTFKSEGLAVTLRNPNSVVVTAVVLVREYTDQDPVPGGCQDEAGPNLQVEWDEHIVTVRFAESGLMVNGSCAPSPNTDYEVYHRYLEEHDLEEGRLLADMPKSMMMEKDILELGDRVRAEFVHGESNGTRMIAFAAYPGTASVFAVVVRQLDGLGGASNASLRSAVYVSSATYACNLDTTQPHNCLVMNYTLTKIICAFSVFVGLYVAFFGHRQFKSSQFFFGFLGGCLVGYIAIAKLSPLSYNWMLLATGGVGTAVGLLWLALWLFLGIPILAALFPTCLLGLLMAGVVLFVPGINSMPGLAESNTSYWMTVLGITLFVPIVLLSFTKQSSILSCVIIGAFAVIIPIDHYTGSSLKFILVNVLRRATRNEFQWAVQRPPFQHTDIALVAAWAGLALFALLFQHLRERQRAPFPPNPYQQWRWRREERDYIRQNAENEDRRPLVPDDVDSEAADSGGAASIYEENLRAAREAAHQQQHGSVDSQDTLEVSRGPVVGYIKGRGRSGTPRSRRIDVTGSTTYGSCSSTASSPARSRSINIESESLQRRSRDIFKPPTPEGDVV